MRDVKLINGLLWVLNALFGAGILAFAWLFLLAKAPSALRDITFDEGTGTVTQAQGPPPSDAVLVRLPNPMVKSGPGVGDSAPALRAQLKGTLPSEKDPTRGVAFIKSIAKNVELVAYMGEEIFHDGKAYDEFRGWKLIEVSKDRASFSNGAQRADLQLDQSISSGPSAAGAISGAAAAKIGQAYSSGSYKSRLLAQADGRQVWGVDPDEADWAVQNADRIMDQDFQVSPSANGGVRIDTVVAGSIGHARGLQAGDIIKDVNGQTLNSIADVKALLNNPSMRQQTGFRITVERAGKPVVFEYRPLPR